MEQARIECPQAPGRAVASSWSKSNTDRWARGFATLAKFRAREGHCCPLRHHVEGNYKLGDWVSVQRYRKKFLPLERKRLLNAIGFVWVWRDYVWEQNYAALLKFKRQKGHCCVPTHYRDGDIKLGWWVATQRRKKKANNSVPDLVSFEFLQPFSGLTIFYFTRNGSTAGHLGRYTEPMPVRPFLAGQAFGNNPPNVTRSRNSLRQARTKPRRSGDTTGRLQNH